MWQGDTCYSSGRRVLYGHIQGATSHENKGHQLYERMPDVEGCKKACITNGVISPVICRHGQHHDCTPILGNKSIGQRVTNDRGITKSHVDAPRKNLRATLSSIYVSNGLEEKGEK